MAKKVPKRWVYSPPSKDVSSAFNAASKAQLEVRVRELIDKELKPKHIKPPPKDASFNYLTDITLKWHGSTLFLVGVYACPGPDALSPSFEDRFARLKPAGGDRFDLDFKRHTGAWVPLYQGLTLEECLKAVREDPWFTP